MLSTAIWTSSSIVRNGAPPSTESSTAKSAALASSASASWMTYWPRRAAASRPQAGAAARAASTARPASSRVASGTAAIRSPLYGLGVANVAPPAARARRPPTRSVHSRSSSRRARASLSARVTDGVSVVVIGPSGITGAVRPLLPCQRLGADRHADVRLHVGLHAELGGTAVLLAPHQP